MLEIKNISFKEFYGNPMFAIIVDEYGRESEIDEMAPANKDIPLYEKLNNLGALHVFCAFWNKELVGYGIVMISPNLHYSKKLAVTESFFVRQDYRKKGAGIALLAAMEKKSIDEGAICLCVSTPTEGKLFDVMRRKKGYRQTNSIFLKKLT